MEILNSKQPKRVGTTQAIVAPEEGSPLRTQQYLKTTLGGESPSLNNSLEADDRKKTTVKVYDFSSAELPFSNFASVQEKRDREAVTTIGTNQVEEVRGPSVQEYYSLARR